MNLIYKFPDLVFYLGDKRYEEAQAGLVELLHNYYETPSQVSIQVFFDGKKNHNDETYSEEQKGIWLHYSHDVTADDLIIGYLKQCAYPSQCLVVTSDKEILSFARRTGAKRITSEDFYKEWKKDWEDKQKESEESVKTSDPTAEDTAYWEKEFNR